MQHFIACVYQKYCSILPTEKWQTICINEGAKSPLRVTILLCRLLCCLGLMYNHRTIGSFWLERSSSPTHSSNARQQYELRTLKILKSPQRHCRSAMSWKSLSFCDYTGPDGLRLYQQVVPVTWITVGVWTLVCHAVKPFHSKGEELSGHSPVTWY